MCLPSGVDLVVPRDLLGLQNDGIRALTALSWIVSSLVPAVEYLPEGWHRCRCSSSTWTPEVGINCRMAATQPAIFSSQNKLLDAKKEYVLCLHLHRTGTTVWILSPEEWNGMLKHKAQNELLPRCKQTWKAPAGYPQHVSSRYVGIDGFTKRIFFASNSIILWSWRFDYLQLEFSTFSLSWLPTSVRTPISLLCV